jgi:hypothetical protein
MRPPHSHITQTVAPVAGCPACALIRPEVMSRAAFPYLRSGAFGPAPRPL